MRTDIIPSGSRHVGREYALRILYGFDVQERIGVLNPSLPQANWWKDDDRLSVIHESQKFAYDLVLQVRKDRQQIDQYIQKNIRNWRIERLSPVDRNILRLSTCELLHNKETPANVIINEAIELAKCYGESDSAKFLNGVLDAIANEVRE